jgi:hypothetical protein
VSFDPCTSLPALSYLPIESAAPALSYSLSDNSRTFAISQHDRYSCGLSNISQASGAGPPSEQCALNRIMASHDVLPQRNKSKRGRPSNPARDSNHTANASPTSSSSTPRAARPSLASRTSSAPLLPANKVKTPNLLSEGEANVDLYSIRDSVTSIKDDPFFRNYQSPSSVSLARELRSATYSERMRDGKSPHEPLPPSPNKSAVGNSVNLPVSLLPLSLQATN